MRLTLMPDGLISLAMYMAVASPSMLGVGGQDQLFDAGIVLKAHDELLQVDILGADAVHGRNGSMEDVVLAVKFFDPLHGHDVPRAFHHADDVLAAAVVAADGAGILVGQIAADGAVAHGLFGVRDGVSQCLCLFIRQGQNVKGQSLRRLASDAGQLGQLVDQAAQGPRILFHTRSLHQARDVQPAGQFTHLGVGDVVDLAHGFVDSRHHQVLKHFYVVRIYHVFVDVQGDDLLLSVDGHADSARRRTWW